MIAKFTSGYRSATVSTAFAIAEPTAITRSYFCRASLERFGDVLGGRLRDDDATLNRQL